jgi:hypothetical protein
VVNSEMLVTEKRKMVDLLTLLVSIAAGMDTRNN